MAGCPHFRVTEDCAIADPISDRGARAFRSTGSNLLLSEGFSWRKAVDLPLMLPVSLMMEKLTMKTTQWRDSLGYDRVERIRRGQLSQAWAAWLGEVDTSSADAKAALKTMEGVNWQAAPEPKKTSDAEAAQNLRRRRRHL